MIAMSLSSTSIQPSEQIIPYQMGFSFSSSIARAIPLSIVMEHPLTRICSPPVYTKRVNGLFLLKSLQKHIEIGFMHQIRSRADIIGAA